MTEFKQVDRLAEAEKAREALRVAAQEAVEILEPFRPIRIPVERAITVLRDALEKDESAR